MRKVLIAVVIVAAALGVLMAVIIAAALYDHEAFRKVIVRADEKMRVLGGGITNGRRSAERVVMAWAHDRAFDTLKLKDAIMILIALDKDEGVEAIRLDFRDSGIKDADLTLLQGLPKLKSVDLSRTSVTPEGVAVLLNRYPQIQVNTNDFAVKMSK